MYRSEPIVLVNKKEVYENFLRLLALSHCLKDIYIYCIQKLLVVTYSFHKNGLNFIMTQISVPLLLNFDKKYYCFVYFELENSLKNETHLSSPFMA